MALIHTIDGNLAIWEYQRLCVLGLYGTLDSGISKIAQLYKNNLIEFAPIKKEPLRDFLAAFLFDPVVDITIVQAKKEVSIVSYSLNKEGSKKAIQDLVDKIGFLQTSPPSDLVETIGDEIELIETITYKRCCKLAELSHLPLKNAFGAIRYANFLVKYVHLSENESIQKAAERFGLKIDF